MLDTREATTRFEHTSDFRNDPLGPLNRPRESPALLCASVARGTFELLARVAALDAVAERHAAVALHEEALVGYMDECKNTPPGALSRLHYRALQMLAVPRRLFDVCGAMLAEPAAILAFEVTVPFDPRRALERRFTRKAVRLLGDAPWPAGPVPYPTLVVLGARTYVQAGDRVEAHAGPGTAFASWRRQLRAALGFGPDDDDRFSDYLGNGA